jgi:ferrochelatase
MASILNNTIKSQNFNPKETMILFSAHSLPADFVWDGEKYPYYIYESCQLTIDALKNLGCQVHFDLGYQSKVGLNKWLRPATHHSLK